MKRGLRLTRLRLTMQESIHLIESTRRYKTSQALASRARITLACAQGTSNREVAERVRVTAQTVGKWRRGFVERRLNGLLDEPRPGNPRQYVDVES